MNKIPVTIITGFLESGKTTLINQLLKQNHTERIAVIVNEYGEIGIDHQLVINSEEEIFQMNNGCLCCSLRADLSNVLHSILEVSEEKEIEFDRIVIETTGLAAPGPIAQTFFRMPFLQENFVIDSVMTLVDSTNALHQIAHYEESVDQIAFADQLWLTKTEKVDSETEKYLRRKLNNINPGSTIDVLDIENISFDSIFGKYLFNATNILEKAPKKHHDHNEYEHDHAHTHGIVTISLQADRPLNPILFDEWMNELIVTFNMDMLRYKGIIHLYGDPHKVIFQGVNMALEFTHGSQWGKYERSSVLVFIGKNLPVKEIEQSFQECMVKAEFV
ncbi:GTP-binding protein [Marinilactibacillus sp. XAAS-LB27]|uniref:CobW family GTP-binding protein n=1 Tax=Marinilactibacillus sp. XAAS-LB27 TaxID=3114538 RepID=UPI002E18BAB6|nr:GTP-binding protein [Marinilactibacillus sp. XAAS-LB27]